MGIIRSQEEKDFIVNEYLSSNLTLTEYSKSKNIPYSTLYDWLKRQNNYDEGFKDVTELVKEFKSITNINSNIKLKYNNLELEFDLNILKQVIEALHD